MSLLLGLSLGVISTLTIQRAISEADASKGKGSAGAQLDRQQFHDSLDVVLDRYVEPVDAPEVMSRGLKHMVAGLDPYSHYLTANERDLAKKRQRQGADAGLVTSLHRAGNQAGAELEVIAVHPGSPADKLGIGAGTRILAIRGRPSAQLLSNVEAQLQLSGAAGEIVALTIDRGSGPELLDIELAKPSAAAGVSAELIDAGGGHFVGAIEIHSFRPGTGDQVKRALAELRGNAGARGLAGVVLDLRGNPGGEVDEAVLVADLFVKAGVLTRTRGRGGVIMREELATEAGTDSETPLVVLQDRRSASAAELLAVALQDNHRAKLLGERSFGKGTVQEVIGIPDGSLLTLTVARYFSPDDRGIDGHGVEPDVALEQLDGRAGLDAATRELVSQAQ
ncbi:carboxyl-terminal protease [Enhygromyxa salina]|uniref:Carboxyl-terminal protease n=1 Tax=Enhygromyxa salina TaxID=215803 RepID=A0A0C1ZNF0_9BACT|nr:carboxyl-terminal protease [Enhygromyxa salina]